MKENITAAVGQFMEISGQTTNSLNAKQACLYTGLQLEEMAEKIEAIVVGAVTPSVRSYLEGLADTLIEASNQFKAGLHTGDILRGDREALLDADIDLAWVSLGAAFSLSRDVHGAIAEVTRANLSKFPSGVAKRDENGKVVKPVDWRGPDLSPFVEPPKR